MRCAFCGNAIPSEDLPLCVQRRGKRVCLTCGPPAPAREFDGWVLKGTLGAGGLGIVSEVFRPATGERAAVKVLKASGEVPPQQVKRFTREAMAMVELDHPHVLRVLGSGFIAPYSYLILELAPNGSMDRLLRRGPLSVRWAAKAWSQGARGLAYCHGRGIVHRDVKPSNLLFDAAWNAKIGDFGLVRFDDSHGMSAMTAPDKTTGTVLYMAPEQIENATRVSPATDVWALGASLYETISGRPPFRGKTPLEVFTSVHGLTYEPVSDLAFGIPRVVDRLLERIFVKDPAQRPAMSDVAAALERIAAGGVTGLQLSDPALEQRLVDRARAQGYLTEAELERLRTDTGAPFLERLREESGLTPEQLADLDDCYRGWGRDHGVDPEAITKLS